MTPHIVRYTVRPDQTAHNDELLRSLFAELDQLQPSGLRYAAFKLADGVSYIHFIWMDADKGHGRPPKLEALKAFHTGIRERCDDAPVRAELTEIGSFRLFGAA